MQTAGAVIVLVRELSTRVERREDHLQRGLLQFRMPVDGDPTAIVLNGHRAAVLVQGDDDPVVVPRQELIDGVVDDLPDQVVQAACVRPADVHRGTAADRLQPFQDFDVFRSIARFGRRTGHLLPITVPVCQ